MRCPICKQQRWDDHSCLVVLPSWKRRYMWILGIRKFQKLDRHQCSFSRFVQLLLLRLHLVLIAFLILIMYCTVHTIHICIYCIIHKYGRYIYLYHIKFFIRYDMYGMICIIYHNRCCKLAEIQITKDWLWKYFKPKKDLQTNNKYEEN